MKSYFRTELSRLTGLFSPTVSGRLRASLCWAIFALLLATTPVAAYAVALFAGGRAVDEWAVAYVAAVGGLFALALAWRLVLSFRGRRLPLVRRRGGFN